MDKTTTIDELKEKIRKFVQERDWDKFHNPKDLGLALSIEVSEILEHFRFKNNEEIRKDLDDSEKRKEISHEIADALYFLIRLADVCHIDLATAVNEKLEIAGKKYPVEKVKGKPYKYTYYQSNHPASSSLDDQEFI